MAAGLAACEPNVPAARPAMPVRVVTVETSDVALAVALTGEVRAQVQSDHAFRVVGRMTARNADVGAHVDAGQVLAQIDPLEQRADLAAARASVESAEAQLRQASAAFDRQKALLTQGFTTRRSYDQAEESFRTAQGSLDAARTQFAVARDQLSHTTLRAAVSGTVIARHAEVGQVVQPGQAVFTIARDGARDAVFAVPEAMIARDLADRSVDVTLLSDPAVAAKGIVREIMPNVDPATGTVMVKVAIETPPAAMGFGAAVGGTGRFPAARLIALPASALSARAGDAAVWIVDPGTQTVTLRPVRIAQYDSDRIFVRDGLAPGEVVVTSGGQLLRPGQSVTPSAGEKS
jgi:RND family efflux transporter MFP subunit